MRGKWYFCCTILSSVTHFPSNFLSIFGWMRELVALSIISMHLLNFLPLFFPTYQTKDKTQFSSSLHEFYFPYIMHPVGNLTKIPTCEKQNK